MDVKNLLELKLTEIIRSVVHIIGIYALYCGGHEVHPVHFTILCVIYNSKANDTYSHSALIDE